MVANGASIKPGEPGEAFPREPLDAADVPLDLPCRCAGTDAARQGSVNFLNPRPFGHFGRRGDAGRPVCERLRWLLGGGGHVGRLGNVRGIPWFQ
jgi:hypothetical protein